MKPITSTIRSALVQFAKPLIHRMSAYSAFSGEMANALRSRGYSVVLRHYYSPIPDAADLPEGYWTQTSEMLGVKIDPAIPLGLIDEIIPSYLTEFRERFAVEPGQPNAENYTVVNGVYMAVDSHIYYSLIRSLKPKRIIEIGSGQSTRIAAAAVAWNSEKDGTACQITCIEPYPPDILKSLSNIEVIQNKLQLVDLQLFQDLGEDDILFIDSTHVLREGSDVQMEFLEILPRLRDGVYVHIHDISLPERYPKSYFDQHLFWNEQQLLQAFLAFNERFEVIWPGNWMMVKQPELMNTMFPEIAIMRQHYPQSEPTAFWMRTKALPPKK